MSQPAGLDRVGLIGGTCREERSRTHSVSRRCSRSRRAPLLQAIVWMGLIQVLWIRQLGYAFHSLSDTLVYIDYASRWTVPHRLPYIDFKLGYPPLALLLLLLPHRLGVLPPTSAGSRRDDRAQRAHRARDRHAGGGLLTPDGAGVGRRSCLRCLHAGCRRHRRQPLRHLGRACRGGDDASAGESPLDGGRGRFRGRFRSQADPGPAASARAARGRPEACAARRSRLRRRGGSAVRALHLQRPRRPVVCVLLPR